MGNLSRVTGHSWLSRNAFSVFCSFWPQVRGEGHFLFRPSHILVLFFCLAFFFSFSPSLLNKPSNPPDEHFDDSVPYSFETEPRRDLPFGSAGPPPAPETMLSSSSGNGIGWVALSPATSPFSPPPTPRGPSASMLWCELSSSAREWTNSGFAYAPLSTRGRKLLSRPSIIA